MTCIVGIETSSGVWLGADSWSCSADGDRPSFTIAESKLFKKDSLIFGSCGSIRFANVVKFLVPNIKYTNKSSDPDSILGWIVRKWIPVFRKVILREGLVVGAETNHEADDTGELLLGVGGVLLAIGSDFGVERVKRGYNAIGSGASIACGALHALIHNERNEPKHDLRLALEASRAHSPFVKGPFTFLSENTK